MIAALIRALDDRARRGRPARFWLRDDDAAGPTPALDRMLRLTAGRVPLTLAAIPAVTRQALADRLAGENHVQVAVHGWSHANHAAPGEKAQELGRHRPAEAVLAELARGFTHLATLHGAQFVPLLVPPWNRIDAAVVAGLPSLGFRGLSVFGPEKPTAVPMVNTHVDLIDWRGTRGGRPETVLIAEILARLDGHATLGLLTHHLVHDDAAWSFLTRLFAATEAHPGCRWVPVSDLIG